MRGDYHGCFTQYYVCSETSMLKYDTQIHFIVFYTWYTLVSVGCRPNAKKIVDIGLLKLVLVWRLTPLPSNSAKQFARIRVYGKYIRFFFRLRAPTAPLAESGDADGP
jgi:hypothetical protein